MVLPPELIKDFIGTLNECEFARYAPGNQNEAMDKVYSSAVEVISKMENSIKTLNQKEIITMTKNIFHFDIPDKFCHSLRTE